MGMYWGAKLFYGVDLGDTNPLYGKYDPEEYDYEFEEPFEETWELIAYRDGIEIPDPYSLDVVKNNDYEVWGKDPEFLSLKAEREYIANKVQARVPFNIEQTGYDHYYSYIVKGYYYSTYQGDVKNIPILENPDQETIKQCINICSIYDLPPFEDHGWKLVAEIG